MLETIRAEFVSTAYWTLAGAALGVAATVAFDNVRGRWQRASQQRKLSRSKALVDEYSEYLDVHTIGVGEPYERVALTDSGLSFFIGFPPDSLGDLAAAVEGENLSDWFEVHKDHYFGWDGLERIEVETGVRGLTSLVERERASVAADFIHKRNGCYFNRKKFGVSAINSYVRVTDAERPALSIDLYTTDYFTHKVMRRVYRELRRRGDLIAWPASSDLQPVRAFTTSLGVNAVILLRHPVEGEVFVLTQRSSSASETNGQVLGHVSVNEGVSITDFDSWTKKLSLVACLKRGLNEELNLNEDDLAQHVTVGFYDAFLARGLFEIGITALVEVRNMDFTHLWTRAERAQDKSLEVDRLIPVPANVSAIRQFLGQHAMVPHGLYTFSRIAARVGISVSPEWWLRPTAPGRA